MFIKILFHEEDITIINIRTKQQSLKIDEANINRIEGRNRQYIILVADFNKPLIIMDMTFRGKINREIEILNNIVNSLDLTDIYTILPSTNQDIDFSQVHTKYSPGYTIY